MSKGPMIRAAAVAALLLAVAPLWGGSLRPSRGLHRAPDRLLVRRFRAYRGIRSLWR